MGRKAPSRVRIPPSPLAANMAVALAPVAQLDRASVYGTEGQRFESSRARLEPRRKRRVVHAVRAGALDGDVLEGGAVPVAQVGRRAVRRLQELQQAGVRIRSRANRLVGQEELSVFGGVEGRLRRHRRGAVTVGLRVGVGVEGASSPPPGRTRSWPARASSPRPSQSPHGLGVAVGGAWPEKTASPSRSIAPQKKCTGLTLPLKSARNLVIRVAWRADARTVAAGS